jgi:putative SOS response-associated peptidase YedK
MSMTRGETATGAEGTGSAAPLDALSNGLAAIGATNNRLGNTWGRSRRGCRARPRRLDLEAMCNLYSVRTSRAALARKFGLSDNRMAAFAPLPAIFPGHMAPIIKQSPDGARELVMRSWGFVLLRDGYAPKRVTNARDDKLSTKFWKESFETRRCLVPATSFCEPDGKTPSRWHWFALIGDEPRPLFAFPGLYRQWKGPIKRGGANVDVEVFSFVTSLPNELTRSINPERSPALLLSEEEAQTWLTGTPRQAFGVIRITDPERLAIVQAGFDKEDLWPAAKNTTG